MKKITILFLLIVCLFTINAHAAYPVMQTEADAFVCTDWQTPRFLERMISNGETHQIISSGKTTIEPPTPRQIWYLRNILGHHGKVSTKGYAGYLIGKYREENKAKNERKLANHHLWKKYGK